MARGRGASGRKRGGKGGGEGGGGGGGGNNTVSIGGGFRNAGRVNTFDSARKSNGRIITSCKCSPPGNSSGGEQGEQGEQERRYGRTETTRSTSTVAIIQPSASNTGNTPAVSDMAPQVDDLATDRNIEMLQVRRSSFVNPMTTIPHD